MTRLEPGAALEPLVIPPISRTTLALFAGASGDHNPIHIDTDFARSAGADDVFVHGMLVMAYLGRLLTTHVDQRRVLAFDTRFHAITPVLAELTCAALVVERDESAEVPSARLSLTATRSDGVVVVSGEALVALHNEEI